MNDDTTIQSSGALDRIERPLHRRFLIIVYRDQESRVLELGDGAELVVGRDEEAGLPLEDAKLSRRHARLWRAGDKVYVEDLGSTNGTRVNGVAVQGTQRLGPGDEVGVGAATLVISSLALTVGHHRVLTDGELEERLDAEVDRARRYRRPLSLLMVRLPGVADRLRQHLTTIATGLRQMDLIASYGPREYALLLPEADGVAAQGVAGRLTAAVAGEGKERLAAGVASLPGDAQSAGQLVELARERLRGARAEAPAPKARTERTVLAESRAAVRALGLARRVAAVGTTVLILGETGSGKQVLAEEIHRTSPRAAGPFVHVNCGAISPSLMESELFGHERGAFTGADARHLGLIESAAGGTLFLDEIGEVPLAAQPKLLQFLEAQTFTRVGGTRALHADARVIAATNRQLEAEVKHGQFREDLYFRLAAFVVHAPPLRERPEDIPLLARLFCDEFSAALCQPPAEFSPAAAAALQRYPWPGNVRQLRNAIERAVVLAEGAMIEEAHLPERVVAEAAPEPAPGGLLEERLASLERGTIEAALRECGGNQSAAARHLGITRRSLIYRMKKLGL